MPVRKAKTRGEWKHISPILPIAPVLAKGELMFLVSHGEEQKKILLQGRMWDEVSVCSTVWLLQVTVGNRQWGIDGVFSGIPEHALCSKDIIQEKELKWIVSFICLSVILFLRGRLTGWHF